MWYNTNQLFDSYPSTLEKNHLFFVLISSHIVHIKTYPFLGDVTTHVKHVFTIEMNKKILNHSVLPITIQRYLEIEITASLYASNLHLSISLLTCLLLQHCEYICINKLWFCTIGSATALTGVSSPLFFCASFNYIAAYFWKLILPKHDM